MNIIALGNLYNNNKTCVLEFNIIRVKKYIYKDNNNNNTNNVPQRISSCFINPLNKLIK